MERAVTYSDHSTTVTTRYFTQSTHKSYRPMTQLLPGPQCPNVTHVPTVLLQTSSPPIIPHLTPLVPSFLSRTASLSLSTCTPLPPPPPFLFLSPTLPCLSVCLSLLSCLALTPSPPLSPLSPAYVSPWCFVPCLTYAYRLASHLRAAAGLVRFMSREDGRLRSPPGISLCHQHLASTLPRTRRKYRQ